MKKEGKAAMRKNRRNNSKKERTIMIASSVFVLSALTMTGIYMKSNQTQEQDDGYTLDFTALEDNVEDKYEEIAKNDQAEGQTDAGEGDIAEGIGEGIDGMEDDLDYLPMEVGSGLVTIPGLTDGVQEEASAPVEEDAQDKEPASQEAAAPGQKAEEGDADAQATATPDAEQESEEDATESDSAESIDSADSGEVISDTLHFSESQGLLRPVSGEVLIPFSMDSGVYFSTLDQFKYNPAMVIAADQGAAVAACAAGRVVDVFENEEIGQAITVELGDGYQITYGQLEEIRVAQGSRVEAGETIAFVAAPTKYFSVEGSNLYLKLTLNGAPMDPEGMLR